MYQQPAYAPSHVPLTPPNTAIIQHQQQSTFDFERMLRDNLTDNSSMTTPLRSQFLPNINEDDDSDGDEQNQQMPVPSNRNANQGMNMSIRGSLSKKEGPIEMSKHGLLYSLCNVQQNDIFTPELTTTDMCLSTLYLHEIHHKQQLRRGMRLEESQRFLWQPQQQQPRSQEANVNNEKIPLLSRKT